MKRIFICGPMSGLPDNNYPAFRAKAAELRAQGYHVEDPSENQLPPDTEPGTEWEEYMKMSIRQMMKCERIYMMPGWDNSRGAVAEFALMIALSVDEAEVHSSMMDVIRKSFESRESEQISREIMKGNIELVRVDR